MTAKELKEKYDSDLKGLQDSCDHKDRSEWLPFEWAPAHRDGEAIQCNTCWKILERRNTIYEMTQTYWPTKLEN